MLDNMIGKTVFHIKFGLGKIVSKEDKKISVQFEDNIKKLEYPWVFEKQYMKTNDTELMGQVTQDIEDEQRKKRQEAEQMLKRIKQEREEKGQKEQKNTIHNKTPKPKKVNKRSITSNPAFKCTYCDGGAISGIRVGFNGMCSVENITYNIKKKKPPAVWCSQPECLCKQYLDGKLTWSDLLNKSKESQLCYESIMLRDWKAYAGWHHSGKHKGEPIRLARAEEGSLAVLTTIAPGKRQPDCYIFGVFIIDRKHVGDSNIEGYVIADQTWKIELSPEEAHQILFWKYYKNGNSPGKIDWGSGLVRYLSDEQAVQILQDIVKVRTKQSDKDFAQQFLDHYCTVNKLNRANVATPSGALLCNNI